MRKVVLIIFTVCINAALSAHADLYWYNSGAISNQLGVALAASKTDSSIGCFAQLIYTGADHEKDDFSSNSVTGTSDDDVVVATMFCGQNAVPSARAGKFPLQATAAVVGNGGNGDYYVRVYNAPNLNFNMGIDAPIPSLATYYWESGEHTYTHSATLPDNWVFTSTGGQTSIPIIPEPGVFGLGIIGLISLRLFARKQK